MASTTSNPPPRWVRLARSLWPGRNPLARTTDRVEGVALIVVVLLGLLLLPVMLVLGSLTHDNVTERGEAQARGSQRTVATLTEDAPPDTATSFGNTGKTPVTATWALPDGTTGTGLVHAAVGLEKGARVDVWLDRDGQVVDAPVSSESAAFTAGMVAVWGWLVALAVLALTQCGLHRALDRRRYLAWDRQWAQADRDWNTRRDLR